MIFFIETIQSQDISARNIQHPRFLFQAQEKDNRKNYAKPLFRLAELYLNVAECYAALGDNTNAIKYLNPIRKRGGVAELKESDITSDMTMMDWVRNERFIELGEKVIASMMYVVG